MERKELLGAIFDEIAHHFRLFTVERYAYLALALVAGLCLATAIVVLIVRPYANPSIAVAILGGSGLIAFAAARSTAFFNDSIRMLDEVVKRWSKMSEPEMRSAIGVLQKRSEVSMLLMGVGTAAVVGSVIFAFARVWLIGQEVDSAHQEAARMQVEASSWKKNVAGVQQAYSALKASVTALYPMHVTPNHQVVEIRAGAQPLKKAGAGVHTFTLALHAAPEALATIKRVRYQVRYPGMADLVLASENAADGFATSYAGSGCLTEVGIELEMNNGTIDRMTVDQCRHLGPQWTPPATLTTQAAKA